MGTQYLADSRPQPAAPTLAPGSTTLHRSVALIAALVSALLLGFSTPALADHDPEHTLLNLKGGLTALEQRVWNCEHGYGAGCPGTKGDKGDTGAAGPTGPQGPVGETGAIGPQGPIGVTGATGPQGPIGETGPTGPAGPIGLQGETGLQGAAGPQGDQGIQGEIGATGAQGPQGDIGATGPQGPIGETGAVGPLGPIGNTGATGSQGPIGDTGEQGATGLTALERQSTTCTSGTGVSTLTCTASCGASKKVIGGGVSNINGSSQIVQSYPLFEPLTNPPVMSWTATVTRSGGGNTTFSITAYALCASTN